MIPLLGAGRRFEGYLDGISATAAAAWSLRRLRRAYTGPLIRVRRSSDNAEQDIGYTAGGSLDTAALLAFLGGSNGFVRTIYDQMGVANTNMAQATTARQAQLVAGATPIGGYALDFNANPYYNTVTTGLLQNQAAYTVSIIAKMDSTMLNTARVLSADTVGTSIRAFRLFMVTGTPNRVRAQSYLADGTTIINAENTSPGDSFDVWQQRVCRYSTADKTIKQRIDGADVNIQNVAAGAAQNTHNSGVVFSIGARSDNNSPGSFDWAETILFHSELT